MNAQFQVAQATGSVVATNSTPVRTFSLAKPLTDQAVVLHLGYDQKVKLDFSAIANEKITLVHVGDKLIILFDNKSTITVDPVFDSRHDNQQLLSIELAPGRDVNVQEFASLFPITTDQSVLPAAGDGNGNAQGSGANFSTSTVDALNAGNPLDLLGQEELGTFQTGDPQFLAITGPTVSVTGSIELVVDESFIPFNGTNSAGSTTGPAASNINTQDLKVVFTVDSQIGLQSLTYALNVDNPNTNLIDSLSGQPVVLVQKGPSEVDGVVTIDGKQVTVFTLTLDGNGHITMTDLRGVHENNPHDNNESIHLGTGLVSVTATAVDVSGNSASGTFDLGPHITISDDSPSIDVAQGEGGEEGPHLPFLGPLEVDESALPDGAQTASFSTTAKQDFSGAFTHVDGADGAHITYALSIAAGGVDTHLVDSQSGHEVFLFNENGTIVARVGANGVTPDANGAIVFTLEVNSSSGQVTMTLERSVHEFTPEANVPSNEPIQLSSVPITLTATITDNDGDSDNASIDIGSTIVIHDDSPSLILSASEGSVTIDETAGQQAGTDEVQFTGLSTAAQTAFDGVANKGSDPDFSSGQKDHGAIGYAVNSGLVSASINFGADGADGTHSKLYELMLAKSGVDFGPPDDFGPRDLPVPRERCHRRPL